MYRWCFCVERTIRGPDAEIRFSRRLFAMKTGCNKITEKHRTKVTHFSLFREIFPRCFVLNELTISYVVHAVYGCVRSLVLAKVGRLA